MRSLYKNQYAWEMRHFVAEMSFGPDFAQVEAYGKTIAGSGGCVAASKQRQ
jgi:hypothetical protein